MELVVSASTGAMKTLLPKLAKMMMDEYNLQKGEKEGIKYLHKELESMQVALEKVSEVPADQVDRHVKLWARDMRELSYDFEDAIDSYMLRVAADGDPKSSMSSFSIKGMVVLVTLRARRGIAIEIERIKKEVKVASELRERYRVDDIVVAPPQRPEPCIEDEAKLVGIDRPMEELLELLLGDDARNQKPKLVAIVGPGGMGKTTLANLVYKSWLVQNHFDCRAFVSVFLRPNKKNILNSILRQVSQNVYENTEEWTRMEVINKIRYALRDKRYLIVIDDIWDESTWDHIRWILTGNYHGSKIITTSRNIGVAQFCCSSNNDVDGIIYELQPLSIVDSEKLFNYKVFQEDGCPPEWKDVSNAVLKRCDGLPLAIITIASVFANRQTQTEDQRISVHNSIRTGLENSHVMKVMWGILSPSFYDLPSQLKTCLLYLSIFPEDYIIEKHDLIWRWIAEGFVHAKEEENLYGIGESYFDKLISRSIIQPMNGDTRGRAQACRVHDMVLEFITSLSTEENFVTILNGQHLPSPAKRIRRLSHQNRKAEHAIPHATIDLSHARSFFVFWSATDLNLPLSSFQVLRVLDLENCSSGNIEGIGNLVQLRYLRLTSTYFIELPKEIGNLQFLHTLDLRGPRIKELPSTVVQLRMLGRLYVHTETKLPDEIVNMKSLEELSEINISNYRQNLIKELGNLFKLRVLEMSLRKWDKSYEEPLLECLCNLKKLETLYIFAPDVFLDFMLDVSWGPRYLLRFTACVRRQTEHIFSLSPQRAWFEYCPFSTLPRWINSSLLNLSDLSIMVKKLCQEDLEILGNLPTLHSLDLHVHEATVSLLEITGRTVTDHAMAFRCLANFKFMSREMVLVFRQGAMNRLQMLSLSFRFMDTKYAHGDFDLGWENLTSLKALDVGIDCFFAGDSEVKDLEAAMRNAASLNPNHPTLSLRRHYEREMKCELAGLVRIGPWGANRGRPHDIKVPPCRLKSVTIGSDMVVDSIAFSYSDCNGQQHTAGPWGGYRGSNYTIHFGPTEFLTKVSGTIGPFVQIADAPAIIVTSLTLVTNARSYGPFGRGGGTPFNTPMQSNGGIVGFFVRTGWFVNAIGVYVKPEQETVKEEEAEPGKIGLWGANTGTLHDIEGVPGHLKSATICSGEVINSLAFSHAAGPWGGHGRYAGSDHTVRTARDVRLELLEKITSGFSEEHKIGSGGYGKVYKGVLNGTEIAVKKLHAHLVLDDVIFKNELENLMRVQHQNIVELVGYCYEIRHRCVEHNGRTVFAEMVDRVLCFEYLRNGSLDKHLYEEHRGLDWCTRYKIIKGICEGLNYLHGLEESILHLDLKPANILLDENMVPKIADFGLSRLFGGTHTHITKNHVGTEMYMPPEYVNEGKITKKYDVFSLGVIIIQIMTGREGYSKYWEMSSQQFIELVHQNWKVRVEATSMHTSAGEDCKQVKRCIEIALNCVEPERQKRPTIGDIIHKLRETETMTHEVPMPFSQESGSASSSHFKTEMVQNWSQEMVQKDFSNQQCEVLQKQSGMQQQDSSNEQPGSLEKEYQEDTKKHTPLVGSMKSRCRFLRNWKV